MIKTTLQKQTVNQTSWDSANISQRIAYAQKALSSDELPRIFYNDGIIGWEQLPLKIRRKIMGTEIDEWMYIENIGTSLRDKFFHL